MRLSAFRKKGILEKSVHAYGESHDRENNQRTELKLIVGNVDETKVVDI